MSMMVRGPNARRILAVVLAATLGCAVPGAWAAGTATATVEVNAPSNVGDVAEVGINLDYSDVAPTVMIVYLAFDNMRLATAQDYYESIPVDSQGNPVRDGDGNVQATLSAVLSAPEVAAAGKTVSVAYYATLDDNVGRGGIGIVVAGLNTDPLPKGKVLTVAFRVLNNNHNNDVLALYGVDSVHPAIISSHLVASSASASTSESIALTVPDGSIALGCARPGVPSGVTASQNQTDRVDIAWTGTAGLEYRVFRSAGSDPLAAQALGDSWTTATTFEDVTADAATVITSAGCFKKGVYETIPYNYWVKSRDPIGACESDYSSPAAQGWRASAAKVIAAAWPPRDPAAWIVFAVAAMILAMRARRARRFE